MNTNKAELLMKLAGGDPPHPLFKSDIPPQPRLGPWHPSSSLVEHTKGQEGFSSEPYWDVERWSIGHGTQSYQGEPPISRGEGESRMVDWMLKSNRELLKAKPSILNAPEGVRDGLFDMMYNLGLSRTMGFKGMWEEFDKKNWQGVIREMKDSEWFRDDAPNRVLSIIEMMNP